MEQVLFPMEGMNNRYAGSVPLTKTLTREKRFQVSQLIAEIYRQPPV